MNTLLALRSGAGPTWLAVTLTVLRWLLAAFFVFAATRNLGGDQQMASDFARWGYPDWFRVTTALLQIVGAALLLTPRTAFYGAALLSCVLVGAVFTHALHDPLATIVFPAVFLALVTPLLLAYPFARAG